MYYTYVLLSKKDGNHYIGFCGDLRSRIAEHEAGNVQATRHRLPVELVYYEACSSREKALLREKYFKTGFGKRFLKQRI